MDARIMHINGNSHQFAHPRTADSHYFSHALCSWGWATWIVGLGDVDRGAGRRGSWGWATWRRAWRHYDFGITLWLQLRETTWLEDRVRNPLTVRWYTGLFDLAHAGKLWIWDAQWTFAMWIQPGLALSP
jgi:hypothetical protein